MNELRGRRGHDPALRLAFPFYQFTPVPDTGVIVRYYEDGSETEQDPMV